MNDLIQEIVMSSCQCFPDNFEGNTYTANAINRPNIVNTSLQELDDNARISGIIVIFIPLVSGLLWL